MIARLASLGAVGPCRVLEVWAHRLSTSDLRRRFEAQNHSMRCAKEAVSAQKRAITCKV
jgi:hypothetical protein